jgi:hypothetical protein
MHKQVHMAERGRGGIRFRRSIMAGLMMIAALLIVLWPRVPALAERKSTLVTVAVIAAVLLLVVGVGIEFFDLSGRREERAEWIQNRMTERLRDALGDAPLTVVGYAPPSSRSALVIELGGMVPTEAVRDTVLRVARREASRLGRDIRVADRLEVQSASSLRVA